MILFLQQPQACGWGNYFILRIHLIGSIQMKKIISLLKDKQLLTSFLLTYTHNMGDNNKLVIKKSYIWQYFNIRKILSSIFVTGINFQNNYSKGCWITCLQVLSREYIIEQVQNRVYSSRTELGRALSWLLLTQVNNWQKGWRIIFYHISDISQYHRSLDF